MVLEALHFVGMIVLEPHRASILITTHVGTTDEDKILEQLHEYEVALRDYHSRKVVTEIIQAFKAR